MKLATALLDVKAKKSSLAKVDSAINSSAVHFEDTTPDYNYLDEMATRAKLVKEVEELKTRIQITNATTKLESGTTLAELILRNATLRSELAFYERLLLHTNEVGSGIYGGRTKDSVKKVYADGYDKVEIRRTITALEEERSAVEKAIAVANLYTDLVEL